MELAGAVGGVLVVESCGLQRRSLVGLLDTHYRCVVGVATFAEASRFIAATSVSHSIIEPELPDGHGLDLIPQLKIHGRARIVILTAHGSIASAVTALRRGADDYLIKPASFDQIRETLEGSALNTGLNVRNAGRFAASKPGTFTLERIKWEHIQRVLAESQWNISEAARRLGVHRQSLLRTLRKPPVIPQ